jgi:hypothetical protein
MSASARRFDEGLSAQTIAAPDPIRRSAFIRPCSFGPGPRHVRRSTEHFTRIDLESKELFVSIGLVFAAFERPFRPFGLEALQKEALRVRLGKYSPHWTGMWLWTTIGWWVWPIALAFVLSGPFFYASLAKREGADSQA